MAYASHTNTDVLHALRCGNYAGPPLLLGCFKEASEGNYFEYAVRPNDNTNFAPDCPHVVYFTPLKPGMDQGYRYARILKTVAYICVDETPEGEPVYEKWSIKDHHYYDTTWVRA